MAIRLLVVFFVSVTGTAPRVYREEAFDVVNATGVTYAQAMRCQSDLTGCEPMDLQLDVYLPVAKPGGPALSAKKPAYIVAHGGGNSGGSRKERPFQGAAEFYAARGFVAFNIDYRLAHDHGLLPKSAPTWPAQGAPLVSHVKRNDDCFWPHPQRGSESSEPYTGVLQLGLESGELSGLCVAVDSDNKSLRMQRCNPEDSRQVWHLEHSNINKQPILHAASGKCLDIPAAGVEAQPNLPIEIAKCIDVDDANSTQRWQLGESGALITRNGAMSVTVARELMEWKPSWTSGYPAVRDCKAAVRFVRASAEKYGVDPDRIAVSGGSAGATDMLAVGITFDGDYKDELSDEEDPTLASTHMDMPSQVQAVVAHWSSNGEVELVRQRDPQNRSRYSKSSAPVIEFHGDQDRTIPLARAQEVQAEYAKLGLAYELHVLEGCGHGSWCYDGRGTCGCSKGMQGYGDVMDRIALPFVAKHLQLDLVEESALYI